MMTVMISQPMRGKTNDEIGETKERAFARLKEMGVEVHDVDTHNDYNWEEREDLAETGVKHIPLFFLAKTLVDMSLYDAVYFCKGWEKARGCKIQHEAAKAYGLLCFYEDGDDPKA